jgi:hypothetical protein
MTGLPQDALRTAILKTLADDVEAALKGGKAELDRLMDSLGVKSLSAKLPDGTEVGSVTRVGGKEAPRITSSGKFLAWVQECHPEQTEMIVRPGYTEALLSAMKKTGRPIDPASGEVVPGVEMAETSSYLTVRFAAGDVPGRELVRRAWRDGVVQLPALLELPAGEAGDAS